MTITDNSRQTLEFVKNLLTLLSAGDLSDLPETDKLVEEMFGHIEKLHLSCQQRGKELSIQIVHEADNVGTKLWNLCTRLRREISVENGGNQKRLRRVYLFGRGLGFLLVGVVRGDRGRGEVAGVVKLGLKVVRGCIGEFLRNERELMRLTGELKTRGKRNKVGRDCCAGGCGS